MKKKGFTLIEVLAAGFLVVVGAGGAFALIQRIASFTSNAKLQLEASYLAQEGVEIARNIRDSNFLNIHKGAEEVLWTDGLLGCDFGCEADYADTALAVSQDRFLLLSANGYGYDSGTASLFKRAIIVARTETEPGKPDKLEVSAQVTWQERGRDHKVQAATELYNWLSPAPTP
ncbi:MAG: prepilin-type N-terminal cleavage/methylation domain-containing protein [Candidatus Wildermuthbacteria bacterium]|nr:prepilin-type N-terminal cleavage/methylation domain-containing protein [Candidatus Wildermuthbacteria bacterium]